MAYDEGALSRAHHYLHMEGREQLTVAGGEDVLIITGSNLHIGKLSLEGGELHVDGQIDSLAYEDDRRQGGGFFSRLFG